MDENSDGTVCVAHVLSAVDGYRARSGSESVVRVPSSEARVRNPRRTGRVSEGSDKRLRYGSIRERSRLTAIPRIARASFDPDDEKASAQAVVELYLRATTKVDAGLTADRDVDAKFDFAKWR